MRLDNLTADDVVARLREHEAELHAAGICRLSLFGSVARAASQGDSDIDLAAEFDPAAGIGLLDVVALERRLSEILGRAVDLLPEPVEKPRLQAKIDRDRVRAF